LLSLVFILFLTIPIKGQQRFKAAPLLGFNLSQIDGDDLSGYHRIGLAAGGRVAAVLHPRWRLTLELQYIQQGSSRGRNEFSGSLDKVALQFVEAPLMVQFLEWKFQINLGASYGRLIQYRVIDNTGSDVSDQFTYQPDQFFLLGGLTFLFTDHVGLDLRLSRALTDLQGMEGGGRLTSRNITVRFLYEF
jgi:hypothetical protein